MRRAFANLGAALLSIVWVSPAAGADSQTAILQAISRRVCYEAFWRGDRSLALGQKVLLNLISANGRAYAWGAGFSNDTKPPRHGALFSIRTRGQQSLVTGYYSDFDFYQSSSFGLVKKMIRDVPAEVQVVDYYLPKDCTPQFDPMTTSKEEMIGKIGKAVENETRQLAWTGDPETVESVTANFNFDYPATEVFIPRFNKVFEVTLRDEPYRTKDVPSGAPAVRVEPNESMAAQDSARILKYGIRRTIRYGGQP